MKTVFTMIGALAFSTLAFAAEARTLSCLDTTFGEGLEITYTLGQTPKFSNLVSYKLVNGQRTNVVTYQENYGAQVAANGEVTFHGWTQDQTIDASVNEEEAKIYGVIYTPAGEFLPMYKCN